MSTVQPFPGDLMLDFHNTPLTFRRLQLLPKLDLLPISLLESSLKYLAKADSFSNAVVVITL